MNVFKRGQAYCMYNYDTEMKCKVYNIGDRLFFIGNEFNSQIKKQETNKKKLVLFHESFVV